VSVGLENKKKDGPLEPEAVDRAPPKMPGEDRNALRLVKSMLDTVPIYKALENYVNDISRRSSLASHSIGFSSARYF